MIASLLERDMTDVEADCDKVEGVHDRARAMKLLQILLWRGALFLLGGAHQIGYFRAHSELLN